ncbi:MAG: response regulator transcription factor [Actinomycetota bacterium]
MVATAGRKILVVEDDPTVSDVVVRYLRREGFDVHATADGQEAVDLAGEVKPDLVILDLMLPGLDGHEVLRRIREDAPTPVIMLTARAEEADRVLGLQQGADDYVVKPFSPRELTLRVQAILKRSTADRAVATSPQVLTAGGIMVDQRSHEVEVDGRRVHLTVIEFDLLRFLMARPGTTFGREELLAQVWGYEYGDTSTVTVHIRRLREKIEADPVAPEHVITVWGVGYRFDP